MPRGAGHSYAEVDIFDRNPGPASGFAACPGVPRALLLSLKDTDVRNASLKSQVHNFHGSCANWQGLGQRIPNFQTSTDGSPVDLHGTWVSSQDHEPVWGSTLPISILACPGPWGCSQLVLCSFASLWNTNENNIFLSWTMCHRHWSISVNYRQFWIISIIRWNIDLFVDWPADDTFHMLFRQLLHVRKSQHLPPLFSSRGLMGCFLKIGNIGSTGSTEFLFFSHYALWVCAKIG